MWEPEVELPPSPPAKDCRRRIFVHSEDILPEEMWGRVETYQRQIEELWRHPEGGAIRFETWVPRDDRKTTVTNPRAAYGTDPDGHFGWHNFRLDRIASDRLTILNWSDAGVPRSLRERWRRVR
ncbi:TIGR03985 family CRISPR-associated protein [Lyngbya sp. CCY1209]|nr:TIGR03985 family CRISPR-associated protein [Lyngbya sp. CCY1209]